MKLHPSNTFVTPLISAPLFMCFLDIQEISEQNKAIRFEHRTQHYKSQLEILTNNEKLKFTKTVENKLLNFFTFYSPFIIHFNVRNNISVHYIKKSFSSWGLLFIFMQNVNLLSTTKLLCCNNIITIIQH